MKASSDPVLKAPARLLAALLPAALLALAPLLAHAQQFPALTGRVVDAANVLPPDAEARLTQKLEALETQSRRQLVIATIPDLQGYDIADYGYQLGRAWGIGDKQRNDGALLIVAPNERKLRIEVGYGLEGVLTDGMSSLIINQAIVPKLRAGDLPGGIEDGTDAIVRQLTLPDEEARRIAQEAGKKENTGDPFALIFFLIFILFFFVFPMIGAMRGGGRRHRRSGLPGVIVWPGTMSSGGFGGGSFGGGGFSGGGGSFGGGGSSGSW
ncbi:MAG: TPM domain-containing protein [Novosphingobium sp.]|nr:TPM domain-containing protein [Novosphingobium sp.]